MDGLARAAVNVLRKLAVRSSLTQLKPKTLETLHKACSITSKKCEEELHRRQYNAVRTQRK